MEYIVKRLSPAAWWTRDGWHEDMRRAERYTSYEEAQATLRRIAKAEGRPAQRDYDVQKIR